MIELLEHPEVRAQVAPLSLDGYHRLRDLGLAPIRSELLKGVIVNKVTKSPLHTLTAHRLWDRLAVGLPPGYQLRKEDPLTLTDSEPEPDLALVRGTDADFRTHHPATAELVVEIAVSSLDLDRAKATVYAAAGVPVCWLVIPLERRVEVCTEPGAAGYGRVETFGPGDTLATFYGAAIPLDALFA